MTPDGISATWCPDLLRTLSKMSVTLGRKDYLSIAVSGYCYAVACGRQFLSLWSKCFFISQLDVQTSVSQTTHYCMHTTTHIYGRCETSYMQLMSVGRVTLKLVLRGIQSLTNVDMH